MPLLGDLKVNSIENKNTVAEQEGWYRIPLNIDKTQRISDRHGDV
jgi:hypothetical protein